jgi:hypothetical protein
VAHLRYRGDAGGSPCGGGGAQRKRLLHHPTNQKVGELILAPYGVELSIVENGAEAVAASRAPLTWC